MLSHSELLSRWTKGRWLPITLWLYICGVFILPTPLSQIINTLSNSSNIVACHHAWGRELGWGNSFVHYFKLPTLCSQLFLCLCLTMSNYHFPITIFQLLPTFFNQYHHLSNFATIAIYICFPVSSTCHLDLSYCPVSQVSPLFNIPY